MHIPARYYKRIPQFYFIVGILLVVTSFNMNENPLGAFLYFVAGVVSVIYAVGVHQARRRRRRNTPRADLQPPPDEAAPTEEGLPPPVEKRPAFINDNPAAAEKQQLADASTQSANKRAELINDNPSVAEKEQQLQEAETQTADNEQSQSAREDNDLPQHGGSVASPAQPELKT